MLSLGEMLPPWSSPSLKQLLVDHQPSLSLGTSSNLGVNFRMIQVGKLQPRRFSSAQTESPASSQKNSRVGKGGLPHGLPPPHLLCTYPNVGRRGEHHSTGRCQASPQIGLTLKECGVPSGQSPHLQTCECLQVSLFSQFERSGIGEAKAPNLIGHSIGRLA
jgi:hypothetical protein